MKIAELNQTGVETIREFVRSRGNEATVERADDPRAIESWCNDVTFNEEWCTGHMEMGARYTISRTPETIELGPECFDIEDVEDDE